MLIVPHLRAWPKTRSRIGRGKWLAASIIALNTLTGCAAYPKLEAHPVLTQPAPDAATTGARAGGRAGDKPSAVEILTSPPAESEPVSNTLQAAATPEQIAALVPARDVEITLPPQPLSQFIDTVFGEILQVPYSTGPGVAQRRDVVTLRGPTTVSSRQFFSMVQMALQQYGLAVVIENGTVRIVQDAVLSGQSPIFIRTRTSSDTPSSSRPVLQFFSVSALDAQALLNLLNEVYPNRGSVRFTVQAETNTLMISGSARDVASAASVVDQLDRPRFAGGQIARVEPVFMSTEQLAESLMRVLTTEGFQVSNPIEGRARAITLLPIQYANQLLIFANDPNAFDRAVYWIGQLDRASALGDSEGVFVYTAQNTSAEELGALVSKVSPGSGSEQEATVPPERAVRRSNGLRVGSQPSNTAAPSPTRYGGLTIDPAGNRIIFRGSPSEYERVRGLLEQLDTPPQQVLVEMTIAEVTLTDDTRFGVEWFLDQTITNGTLSASTRGSSVRQAGGLGVMASHVFSRGTVQAALNAFASNRNLNILSTPRLVTRSGSEAQILIGTDVPIITSQRASDSQTSGDSDVLQTVQYRQTGVILNVRPIVYGDDRIDIALYQEVSSQQPNTTAAISSPLILNRSVTTQLSLQEGMTAVIGGLIQDNYTRDQRGVPGLKDVPLLGAAFRSDQVSGDKVELLILVTPYIIHDSDEMSGIADRMSRSVNRTMSRRGAQVYTLYPWRVPFLPGQNHGVLEVRPSSIVTDPVAEAASAVVDPAKAQAPRRRGARRAPPASTPVVIEQAVPPAVTPPAPPVAEAPKEEPGPVQSPPQ